MFWALKPSESFKNLMILKVPGLLELLLAMPGFQNQWKSMILKVPGPWSFCWLGEVSRTNENQSFWRSLASWSFCWPCQASRTNENQWFSRVLASWNSCCLDRPPDSMKINDFESPWLPWAFVGLDTSRTKANQWFCRSSWSNRSVLVGEGIESAACMYNVGPGGWVLYAAALKCEVICQGCAAVLIEKLIYIRRFAHAAAPAII